MSKWYIYHTVERDKETKVLRENLRYYKVKLENPPEKLTFIGECDVDDDFYFIGANKPVENGFMSMYPRVQIAKRAAQARKDNDLELSGMLEWLIQLRFSWIRQIIKYYLEPDPAGLYPPHRVKLKRPED